MQDPLTHPSYNLALRVLSYYIILFPSVDVISPFTLNVTTMVNNLFVVFVGKDSAQASESLASFIVLLLMKFVIALLPILVAMGVSNLVTVFRYAGFVSFILNLFLPNLLQLRSQWVCRKTFQTLGSKFVSPKPSSSQVDSGKNRIRSETEGSPLLITSLSRASHSAYYMTPYSNLFSYWPAVVVIGGVDMMLFILTLAGFFLPSV